MTFTKSDVGKYFSAKTRGKNIYGKITGFVCDNEIVISTDEEIEGSWFSCNSSFIERAYEAIKHDFKYTLYYNNGNWKIEDFKILEPVKLFDKVYKKECYGFYLENTVHLGWREKLSESNFKTTDKNYEKILKDLGCVVSLSLPPSYVEKNFEKIEIDKENLSESNVKIIDVKDQRDGSMTVVLEIDERIKNLLIQKGFNSVIEEALKTI